MAVLHALALRCVVDAARLLSVCWYSPHLVFAGNAASCILRFSRAGTQQAFVADGKMVLESQPITGAPAEGKQHPDGFVYQPTRSSSNRAAPCYQSEGVPTDGLAFFRALLCSCYSRRCDSCMEPPGFVSAFVISQR